MAGELRHLPTRSPALGDRARRMKRRHRTRRLARAAIGVVAVWIAALIAGFVLPGGLGISGLILTFFVMAVVFVLFASFPRLRVPRAADVAGSDLKGLAGQTQLFLEAERPVLPPLALPALDRIGTALDELAPQLQTLGELDPAADEARRLLGVHLPGLIESYTRIPDSLRTTPDGDATPEQQLVDGLGVIATEIAAMTSQIARGELDALATRGRYLETKYVSATDGREP